MVIEHSMIRKAEKLKAEALLDTEEIGVEVKRHLTGNRPWNVVLLSVPWVMLRMLIKIDGLGEIDYSKDNLHQKDTEADDKGLSERIGKRDVQRGWQVVLNVFITEEQDPKV